MIRLNYNVLNFRINCVTVIEYFAGSKLVLDFTNSVLIQSIPTNKYKTFIDINIV